MTDLPTQRQNYWVHITRMDDSGRVKAEVAGTFSFTSDFDLLSLAIDIIRETGMPFEAFADPIDVMAGLDISKASTLVLHLVFTTRGKTSIFLANNGREVWFTPHADHNVAPDEISDAQIMALAGLLMYWVVLRSVPMPGPLRPLNWPEEPETSAGESRDLGFPAPPPYQANQPDQFGGEQRTGDSQSRFKPIKDNQPPGTFGVSPKDWPPSKRNPGFDPDEDSEGPEEEDEDDEDDQDR